jgi:hypothetical protein
MTDRITPRNLGVHVLFFAALIGSALLLNSTALAVPAVTPAAAPAFPGLGDPGTVASLVISAGTTAPDAAGKPVVIVGPDSRLQLVVTANYSTTQVRDWTGLVKFTVKPEGIIRVTASGLVMPMANGAATISAVSADGKTTAILPVTVERFDNPPPINFPNQIVPIFTKLGCNSGGCHGKSGGQNNFRLSLLGFEPTEDYEYLVKESFGRRLSPAAPDHSLLLMKGINALPHGGGERLKADSDEYRLIRRWISQGMPYGAATDPVVTAVTVFPEARKMPQDGKQQLMVVAHYSDGTLRDVTRTAQFEPNDKDLAEVDPLGTVKMLGNPGDVAIMVRYQGQVSTFRATVPLGVPVTTTPPVKNFVDELVFGKLKELGLPPSELCDDSTFIRRVTLDLAGRLPTDVEAKNFVTDAAADKREKAIDRLLASDDYADLFANKWTSVLRNKREKEIDRHGSYVFHDWIRNAIRDNMPYDQFVRSIVAATGEIGENPPVVWYRTVAMVNEQVEDTAQLFLGTRIQCARCHHHPFEKWSQQDYYGLAAFFGQVGRKDGDGPNEARIFHKRGEATATNPKTSKPVKPAGLGGPALSLSPEDDPRVSLVDWMVKADNPFFGPALVNRYWKHFFSRGLVEPEDDMRQTNPPTNPKLLAALASHFVQAKFNLKDLVRTICTSSTYQLTSLPNEFNATDKQNFSRYYPKRLQAEVLLDGIDQLLATRTDFTGLPKGSRAMQIPDHGGINMYFLNVFGRPAGASACECERSGDASLAQSLHLLNSGDIHGKLAASDARKLVGDKNMTDEQRLTEYYFRAFGRPPNASELAVSTAYIAKFPAEKKSDAYEDILWALINTKEFLFNH